MVKQKQNKNKKRSMFLRIFDLKYFLMDFVKVTAAIPTLIALRVKKYYIGGKKQKKLFKGPVIFVSNHTSYIDPVIITTAVWQRRIGFIATKELFNTKMKNIFFKGIGCIPIDKQNVGLSSFKAAQETINRGHAIGIFPEGQITRQNEVEQFKSGVIMFSILCKAPIVQIYILKNKHWWNRQRVIFSEKIDVSSLTENAYPTMEEISKVTKMLYEQEILLEQEIKRRVKKKGK